MDELKNVIYCEPTGQPVSPDVRARDMKLELRHNVVYIVCGIAIDADRVLLIQEAKASCRGLWYLPAGRMEPNETIVEAVEREVLEESGLNFKPEALIAVECHSYLWIRFTLTGQITGGCLKTPAQEDRESIQAGWFTSDPTKLPKETDLRAWDCLSLVKLAREWFKAKEEGKSFSGTPALVGHRSSSLRIIAVHVDSSKISVLTLKQPNGSTVFPACLLGQEYLLDSAIHGTLESLGCKCKFKTKGVLSVEHLGNPNGTYDGMCLSVVVQVTNQQLAPSAQTHWARVEDEGCLQRLRAAVESDFGCTQLIQL